MRRRPGFQRVPHRLGARVRQLHVRTGWFRTVDGNWYEVPLFQPAINAQMMYEWPLECRRHLPTTAAGPLAEEPGATHWNGEVYTSPWPGWTVRDLLVLAHWLDYPGVAHGCWHAWGRTVGRLLAAGPEAAEAELALWLLERESEGETGP